ncbi:olfactory receptor-like protein OLF4 [Polypterus senegalus]|uniref:olfactory receptor-like protein OLF4 n=1 Tax=Polypterus senegalus TaxID=55291 RepID=UPI001965ECC2|nr:olfactory receptor-like protein OLF4 [Polypterus senegalus]
MQDILHFISLSQEDNFTKDPIIKGLPTHPETLMENASDENNIKLMAFQDIGSNKHIYFFIALIVYLLIILFNCSVIFTILLDKGLHEPMYIFLCNLLLSELVGSSSFYIKFLFDIQTDMLVISRPACFIQSFFISLYVSVEISVLMVMAHDRYIAINFPLHYFCLISTRKVQIFIFVAWMYSVLVVTTKYLTVPPLLNPLTYGIILPGIRKRIIYIVSSKMK